MLITLWDVLVTFLRGMVIIAIPLTIGIFALYSKKTFAITFIILICITTYLVGATWEMSGGN